MDIKFEIFLWVCSYLATNTLLTIHNKTILYSFPFPWTLTLFHISISGLGAKAILKLSAKKHYISNKHKQSEYFKLFLFTILNTFNIAFNNISINVVSLTIHQVFRSLGPFITVILNCLIFRKKYSFPILLSLLILLFGVLLCTASELTTSFASGIGICLTLFGVFLASLKSIITNNLTEKMSSLDVLSMMALPCSLQCFIIVAYTREIHGIFNLFSNNDAFLQSKYLLFPKLLVNALLAFGVNYTSFETNRLLGPLSIAVIANLKQVITIVIVHFFLKNYSSKMTNLNAIGIFISCLGGFLYGYLNHKSKDIKSTYLPLFGNTAFERITS